MRDLDSGDLEGAAYLAQEDDYDDDCPTRAEAEQDERYGWRPISNEQGLDTSSIDMVS